MKEWITDLRDVPPESEAIVSAAERRRAAFTHDVVEAATSRRVVGAWCSAIRCIGRRGRRACGAQIEVAYRATDRIEWSCKPCGEHGAITGFAHSEHDLPSYIPKTKTVLGGVSEESRRLLYSATTWIAALRALVARAHPVEEIEGFLRIDATVDELDELDTLIENWTDATRSWQRREHLDGLRFHLSTAIDGFEAACRIADAPHRSFKPHGRQRRRSRGVGR